MIRLLPLFICFLLVNCTNDNEDAISPVVKNTITATFGGGPFYNESETTIPELRESGFTHLVVWTIHMDNNGDMNINGEFPICANGDYIGAATHPDFANNISLLKTAPTSVKRLELGLSAWGSGTFNSIKHLVETEGTGPESVLYRNFSALYRALPSIDAINFDDESTYDSASASAFAIMLADIGFKISICPYESAWFWKSLVQEVNTQRPQAIDLIYLQCYGGGYANVPTNWQKDFPTLEMVAGLWVGEGHDSSTTVYQKLNAWNQQQPLQGGFVWIYDEFKGTDRVQSYPTTIINAIQ